jgi:hypothetical protein
MKTKLKMTVPKARKLAKARSDYHLAQILGVTRQCVSMWRSRGYVGFAYAARLQGESPPS